jgi:hypothetical protein
MALLFMESFDHLAIADIATKWTQLAAGAGTAQDASGLTAVGRHSSNGWKSANPGTFGLITKALLRVLTPGDNTFITGFGFRSVTPFSTLYNSTDPNTNNAGSACLLMARNAGADQCWVRVDSVGTLSVYRGSTLLGTTSVALTQNVYAYIEVLLTIHNTTGVVTIRVNGTTCLSLTGQNTRAGGANAWNELRVGGACCTAPIEWNYDDLYVLDGAGAAPVNTFLGDCRVDACADTAPGANTGWTPSAGANWQCVDDATPNGDTDYTAATTIGMTDTFVAADMPVAGATIYGVQHCLTVKKMDAGAASIAPVVRHAGVDYPGADLNPGTTYAVVSQIATVNPGTGLQWTVAGVNAAEFGYRKTV